MGLNTEKEDINWHVGAISLSGTKVNVGVCSRTRRIAFVDAGMRKPLIITDVQITDGECQDSKFCYCKNCEYANVDYQTILKSMGVNSKDFSKKKFQSFVDLFDKISDSLKDVIKNVESGGKRTIYENPIMEI